MTGCDPSLALLRRHLEQEADLLARQAERRRRREAERHPDPWAALDRRMEAMVEDLAEANDLRRRALAVPGAATGRHLPLG